MIDQFATMLQAQLNRIWNSFGLDSWDSYRFDIYEAMHQAVAGSIYHMKMQVQHRTAMEERFYVDAAVHMDLRNEYSLKHLGSPRSTS